MKVDKHLVIYPSGVIKWVELHRSRKYDDIYCDQLGSFIDSLIERPSGISDQEYAKIAMADTEKKMALATW